MSIQLAKIKNTSTIPSIGKDVEEMKILYITRLNKNSSSTMEIFWQFLIRIKIYLPYNPAISLLSIYPKEMKTYVPTKIRM